MASNRIPRHFTRVTGEMLIETTETRPGDIIRNNNRPGSMVQNQSCRNRVESILEYETRK